MKISAHRPAMRSVRRLVATTAAGALAVAGLSVATPAQAAQTGTVTAGTASWGLSAYLNSSNTGRVNPLASAYVAPAAFDADTRISSWASPTGTVNADGSAEVTFSGTTVNHSVTAGSWLRLKDPKVTVDASGNGTLSAIVSYGTAPGTYTPTTPIAYSADQAPDRPATRVTLAALTNNTSADLVRTSSTATWSGLDSDGWSPDFIDFLDGDASASPPIPAWTFLTGVTGSTTSGPRPPLPVSFTVDTVVPATTATITKATPSTGLSVKVDGRGFRSASPGVYVSLGEEGVFSDTDPAGYIVTNFVPNAQISADGTFSSTIQLSSAQAAALSADKEYIVYTQKAHGQSATDASQNTQTPIEIDVTDFVKKTPTVTIGDPAPGVFGQASTVTASVSNDATGDVVLSGLSEDITATLEGGVATFSLPAGTPVGHYELVATFAGNGDLEPAESTSKDFGVAKATSTTTVKTPAGAYGSVRDIVVTVGGAAGFNPTGTVTLSGVVTETKPVGSNGSVTFTVPATLPVGAAALTATYAGDAGYTGSASAGTVATTQAKVSVKRGTTKKPTTKKTGKSSLTLTSSTGAPVDGKATVSFTKKGQKTKVKTVTIKAGKGNITIPKLAKGKWTVSVKYAGTTNFVKTGILKRGSFTVTK